VTVTFHRVTLIDASIDRVFALSLSVDAHLDSMASSGERAVSGVTSGEIGLGQEVTWSARHFGVRWRMTSRVTVLERPNRFVDEQVRGPFAWFRHEHLFMVDAAKTRMVDVVEFASPGGLLGALPETAVLRWYVPQLIDHRNAFLKAELERLEPR
jgi:ligand-binding SRPBCC domain-containing protein